MNPDTIERCDIVIPVWNQQKLTKECIDSIREYTSYPYRIVIIDNASDMPTRKYLDFLKEQGAGKVVIIRNEQNLGFVEAVNQGMKYSDAEYICVMNNDTLVTEGWLRELIDILLEHSDIGIINPSSNTSCQFPGRLDIDTYAKTLKRLKGMHQELYTCRAFAMVVRRKVIERIGYLDDSYGIGYFDDTDYSKRAQEAGFRTVRAKASYVYHRESQSFSKIKEKNKIFAENEKKFVSKWGRQLRIAYVIPALRQALDVTRISANINRIAKSGHQVWIFTRAGFGQRLNLIDHESIRFYCYPPIFFKPTALYKIWKRRKKKNMHIVLTNDRCIYRIFAFFRDLVGCETTLDSDYSSIEKKVNYLAHSK